MVENKKLKLLENRRKLEDAAEYQRVGYKNGIPIEKGISLNEDYLQQHRDNIGKMMGFFTAYPDLFLDLITPEDTNFQLYFYQRIFLRAAMRFKSVYLTAARAFSKSFLTILALMLQCVFIPGRKVFICAPNKNQGAQIAREKITEIYRIWPLIRNEVEGSENSDTPGNFGKDYVTIKFRNGSQFDVVGALESTLGGRRHGGLIDEIKIHDEEAISTIVLPLLNVSRYQPNGKVNEKEPNQQVICCTSAWQKQSFAYDKLISIFEESIMRPQTAFCMGCDYRVPMLHGLLGKDYITRLKLDPAFNEVSFATEYLSLWQGASDESWFNFERMRKHRKIKNPETHAKFRPDTNQFYLLSVDVGRLNDQTVVSVFRVNIDGQGRHWATLVNLKVIARVAETKTFSQQAIDVKKLIQAFQPREVVIDTNGLGVGLADEMIKDQVDEFGNYYPAYAFNNDENYYAIQPKSAPKILYGIKANGPLNSKIHGNAYSRLSSGLVKFLVTEQEAKSSLMSTAAGQKMSVMKRVESIMPHEMTTKLFEEMANLRLKRTGSSTDIVLEQINPRYPKDKYSSFAYGLWRIKELEEEYTTKRRRRFGNGDSGKRQLTFFN